MVVRLNYFRSFTILAVAAVGLLMLLITARPAHAATFTVNQTGDLGDFITGGACDANPGAFGDQCTLRAAIEDANATPGPDVIHFSIPGTGVHTISPGSPLPAITEDLTIDGYTQDSNTTDTSDDAKANTSTTGTNAVLLIELNGASAGSNANGLKVNGGVNNVVIKGLVINGFDNDGIFIFSGSGHKVEGNFVGTNTSGTAAVPNNNQGVNVGTDSGTVGGTTLAARNLISGNTEDGVLLNGGTSSFKVENNLIGTKANGTDPLANSGNGVRLLGANNIVGDDNPDDDPTNGPPNASNVIAFNAKNGVAIPNDTGNRILGNSIFSNAQLGIDLGNDGPTADDKKDPDTGANNLQNFPVLTKATFDGTNGTTVTGKLNSRPRKTFTIQFFTDDNFFGGTVPGKTFLGQTTKKTNRKGNLSFTFILPATAKTLSNGAPVTATATNQATGDTSEFSAVVSINEP